MLRGKDGGLPDLVHTHPNETIAEAVAILREYGVSQMPVVRAEPPVMAAEVVGSVSERTCSTRCTPARRRLADAVESHMDAAAADHRRRASRSSRPSSGSQEADAVLVLEDGKPVGVLTRQDLLERHRGGLTRV